jgi:hypothetical protein
MSEPEQPREPVVHKKELTARATASASLTTSVERGLNELRLAVLGILVAIGLAIGFGVPGGWPIKLAAGLGAFAAACILIRWKWSRHQLMSFMHRLTGG